VEYYRLAHNLHRLDRLKWVMETALLKTLACKLRTSVNKVRRRYHATVEVGGKRRGVLRVVIGRGEEKRPLVAQWGGISLARRTGTTLDDPLPRAWNNTRTELLERLLADQCELCGSREGVQVHHVRSLKDLQCRGRTERPEWVKLMAARQRKTLVVCRKCHTGIHAGKVSGKPAHGKRHRRAG
jgi:hypothetical protein